MDKSEVNSDVKSAGPSTSGKSSKNTTEKCVESIVKMGYPEKDVKRALRAAFNDKKRAIQYLDSEIPKSPSTPEGNSSYSSDSSDVSPYEYFRTDPVFCRFRQSIWQNPEYLCDAVQRVGEIDPEMLRYVDKNCQEFLDALNEASSDEGEEEDADESDGADGSQDQDDEMDN